MFVKGQKVICIDGRSFGLLKKGSIYTVTQTGVGWVDLDHNSYPYPMDEFKTIVQSIDDIVVGMELTYKRTNNKIQVIEKNKDCFVHLGPIHREPNYLSFRDLELFKEYKPKEVADLVKETMSKEEYEVIEPFNIKNIWDAFKENHSCSEFQREWGQFLCDFCDGELKREDWNIKDKFISFSEECVTKTMWKNKDWFEKKGLIKKKEKDIVLVPGMRLIDEFGETYKVILLRYRPKIFGVVISNTLYSKRDSVPYEFKTKKDIECEVGMKLEVIE